MRFVAMVVALAASVPAAGQDYARMSAEELKELQAEQERILLDPSSGAWSKAAAILAKLPEGHTSLSKGVARFSGDAAADKQRRHGCLNNLASLVSRDASKENPELMQEIPDSVVAASVAYLKGGAGPYTQGQITLLGRMGPRAKAAIPVLNNIRDKGNARDRAAAKVALEKIEDKRK